MNVDNELSSAPVIWLTGLPGAGKTTIALGLRRILHVHEIPSIILDGDTLRSGLCADLGFSKNDRRENVRRAGEVAKLLSEQGTVAILALISPFSIDRHDARRKVPCGSFFEIFISTPLAVCMIRDPKGLYRNAQENRLSDLTGFNGPYETPENPELAIDTTHIHPDDAVAAICKRVWSGSRFKFDVSKGNKHL